MPRAYLRVFEPLDALSENDRERWGAYVAAGRGISVHDARRREARLATIRLVTGREPARGELALVRRVGRRTYVCPLQLAERHAVALLAFRELVPDPVADAFMSPAEARSAVAAVGRLRRPPHIQESSWEVPLRWFVPFRPEQRHLVTPADGSGMRLTYLTVVGGGLERLDDAVEVLGSHLDDAVAVTEPLEDLIDWLASFHDDSLLELDYGGLTEIIPAGTLVTDVSCRELWEALDSLRRGEVTAAVAGYEQVAGRWQVLRSYHRVN